MNDKELIEKLECGCVEYYNNQTGVCSADSGFVNQGETELLMQQAAKRIAELTAEKEFKLKKNLQLESGIKAIRWLINNSHGVEGLNPNGDFAFWCELEEGGDMEGWLIDFNKAETAINN